MMKDHNKPSSPFYSTLKKIISCDLSADEYDFDKCPAEFNAWMGFRLVVDVILANDLGMEFCEYFCASCFFYTIIFFTD